MQHAKPHHPATQIKAAVGSLLVDDDLVRMHTPYLTGEKADAGAQKF
jgi:hypothetical protein